LSNRADESKLNTRNEFYQELDTKAFIDKLAKLIYCDPNNEEKTLMKALLYQSYHHAVHNRYKEARDLLLMSHVSEKVHSYDIGIQALYNRVLV